MAATMSDVARRAGVSVKTVSNVINGHPYIRASTRRRVEEAIRELDYRVNISARNLRSGRSGTIALAIPELTQPYFAELAQAVIDVAATVDLTVFVETTGGDVDRELAIVSGRREVFTDGLIFSPQGIGPDDASAITPTVPTVLLGERIFHSSLDHVTMANEAAANEAVTHLLATGRRRVVLLGAAPDDPVVGAGPLRLRGARAAYAEAGVDLDPRLVVAPREWSRDAGEATVRALLEQGMPFDAVFGMNDALALGALRALVSSGRRVPEDVAVAGFDNTLDARFSTPSLTSVDPGRREIAGLAVDLLHRRLSGQREDEEHEEVVASFRLEVRESTAA